MKNYLYFLLVNKSFLKTLFLSTKQPLSPIEPYPALKLIAGCGISLDDKRFGDIESISSISSSLDSLPEQIDYNIFHDLVTSNTLLLNKIFEKDLVISDWDSFCHDIDEIYLITKKKSPKFRKKIVFTKITHISNLNFAKVVLYSTHNV